MLARWAGGTFLLSPRQALSLSPEPPPQISRPGDRPRPAGGCAVAPPEARSGAGLGAGKGHFSPAVQEALIAFNWGLPEECPLSFSREKFGAMWPWVPGQPAAGLAWGRGLSAERSRLSRRGSCTLLFCGSAARLPRWGRGAVAPNQLVSPTPAPSLPTIYLPPKYSKQINSFS